MRQDFVPEPKYLVVQRDLLCCKTLWRFAFVGVSILAVAMDPVGVGIWPCIRDECIPVCSSCYRRLLCCASHLLCDVPRFIQTPNALVEVYVGFVFRRHIAGLTRIRSKFFGHFRRNTQILGLIPLEFVSAEKR